MNKNTLEARIRNIAANMEGAWNVGGIKIPHTVFVQWDSTWDVVYDNDLDENASDEELEQLILHQEYTHDEYYHDEIMKYEEENAQK